MNIIDDVGSCKVNKKGEIVQLHRECFGQGMIFKSWRAYENDPTAPCYVPELSDEVYTADDFLELCSGDKEFVDKLFKGCDWQHPLTLMDEWFRNNEWVMCPVCGNYVNYGDGSGEDVCRNCGKKIDWL